MDGEGKAKGWFPFYDEWLVHLEKRLSPGKRDRAIVHAVLYGVHKVRPPEDEEPDVLLALDFVMAAIDRTRRSGRSGRGAGGGPPKGAINNPWGKKGAPLTLAPVGDHTEGDPEWANYMKFLDAVAKAAPTFARARRDVVTTYAEFRALKVKYGSERLGEVIRALGGPYDWKRNKKPMTMVIDEWCMRQVRKEEKGT